MPVPPNSHSRLPDSGEAHERHQRDRYDKHDSSSSTSSTSTSSSNTVDYNTFLQLLIAEMKNQDPTNPMDTSQYMSQFAQLSSVEQAMQTNYEARFAAVLAGAVAGGRADRDATSASPTTTGATVTGKIASVSINSDGSVATLEDGTKVAVGPGLTIS